MLLGLSIMLVLRRHSRQMRRLMRLGCRILPGLLRGLMLPELLWLLELP